MGYFGVYWTIDISMHLQQYLFHSYPLNYPSWDSGGPTTPTISTTPGRSAVCELRRTLLNVTSPSHALLYPPIERAGEAKDALIGCFRSRRAHYWHLHSAIYTSRNRTLLHVPLRWRLCGGKLSWLWAHRRKTWTFFVIFSWSFLVLR